jgi:hypothetical protein
MPPETGTPAIVPPAESGVVPLSMVSPAFIDVAMKRWDVCGYDSTPISIACTANLLFTAQFSHGCGEGSLGIHELPLSKIAPLLRPIGVHRPCELSNYIAQDVDLARCRRIPSELLQILNNFGGLAIQCKLHDSRRPTIMEMIFSDDETSDDETVINKAIAKTAGGKTADSKKTDCEKVNGDSKSDGPPPSTMFCLRDSRNALASSLWFNDVERQKLGREDYRETFITFQDNDLFLVLPPRMTKNQPPKKTIPFSDANAYALVWTIDWQDFESLLMNSPKEANYGRFRTSVTIAILFDNISRTYLSLTWGGYESDSHSIHYMDGSGSGGSFPHRLFNISLDSIPINAMMPLIVSRHHQDQIDQMCNAIDAIHSFPRDLLLLISWFLI